MTMNLQHTFIFFLCIVLHCDPSEYYCPKLGIQCGPMFDEQICNGQGPLLYCDEDNGWCGSSSTHQNAQESTKYDYASIMSECNGDDSVCLTIRDGDAESFTVTNNAQREMMTCSEITSLSRDISLMHNTALLQISFTMLTNIGGNLELRGNILLNDVDFPELTTIGADLDVGNNDELTVLLFPALTNIGESIYVSNNINLQSVDLPSLTMITNSISFLGNTKLQIILFCILNYFTGSFGIDGNIESVNIVICGDVPWDKFSVAEGNYVVGCNSEEKDLCFLEPEPEQELEPEPEQSISSITSSSSFSSSMPEEEDEDPEEENGEEDIPLSSSLSSSLSGSFFPSTNTSEIATDNMSSFTDTINEPESFLTNIDPIMFGVILGGVLGLLLFLRVLLYVCKKCSQLKKRFQTTPEGFGTYDNPNLDVINTDKKIHIISREENLRNHDSGLFVPK